MVGYDVYSPHYNLHGKLTGYRLLVIGGTTTYVLYRLVLLAFDVQILPLPLEAIGLAACSIGLYYLGTYQDIIPPCRPEFFHDDYVHHATPYLRTVALFFLALFCFLGPVFSIIFTALAASEVTDLVMQYISTSQLAVVAALLLMMVFLSYSCVTAYTYLSQVSPIRDVVSGFGTFANDRRTFPTTMLHSFVDGFSTFAGVGLGSVWLTVSVVPWWKAMLSRHVTSPGLDKS